jgi:hypothetical protein
MGKTTYKLPNEIPENSLSNGIDIISILSPYEKL